jgi:hypothetical protein
MDTRQQSAGSRGSSGLTVAFLLAGIAASVCMRLVPYWFGLDRKDSFFWNAMPVGALGLFAGARWRGWAAWLVPSLVMLLSDLLLIEPLARQNFAAFSWSRPVLYASLTLYVVLGRLTNRFGGSWSVIGGSILGSLQFFLISNFLAWLGDDGLLYTKTFGGLMDCYVAGLPFLRNTAAGDLLYTGLFFGLYALVVHLPQREKASQPA